MPAIVLYGYAAWRYLVLWRRRRAPMLVAMMAAFLLLAEAMVAIAFARNWHLSWWEWHVLMLAAFALVAVGARDVVARGAVRGPVPARHPGRATGT